MQVRRGVDFRCLYYIASVMLFLLPAAGSAQTAAQSKLSLAAIRELPGEEIGRGVNQIPSTDLELHTYRVERLNLPSQVKAKIDGIKVTVKKAWRITISGEHFRVGAMPAIPVDRRAAGGDRPGEPGSNRALLYRPQPAIRQKRRKSGSYVRGRPSGRLARS